MTDIDLNRTPVWWYECEDCGKSLPEGVPAIVEMVFGCLPNAVYCMDCWDGELAEAQPRPVPDGGVARMTDRERELIKTQAAKELTAAQSYIERDEPDYYLSIAATLRSAAQRYQWLAEMEREDWHKAMGEADRAFHEEAS